MTSRLGFFRFLSTVNLLIASFFLFIMLMALLMMPSLTPILIFALITGAVVIHSILSLALQKSLVNPEVPLKSNTPGGIKIMGFMAMFYGILLVTNGWVGLTNLDEMLSQTMKQMPKQQPTPDMATMRSLLRGFLIFFLIHAAGVIANCAMSFSLLRKWQLSQQEKKND